MHGVVTFTSLPVSIDLGPGNEHESRRLITLLKDIRIKGTRRPRSRPKQVYADTKYNTPLVMMYLASRGIAARIKERVNTIRERRRDPGQYSVSLTMECTLRLQAASRDSMHE
jgi:hypothetical protein